MKKVSVGFIGAGRFANEVHYPSLAEFGDVEIAAVCDLDRVRLDSTADTYEVERRYTNFREMLDRESLDAVYVCTPPHHLFDVVADCLKRGQNVFVEKPPGVSAEQTRSFARLADASGSLSMVGFNRRFMPVLNEVRGIVEQRGPMSHCQASYYKHYLVDEPYYDGPATMLVLDGIHAVDTLRWLGGDVESVTSRVARWRSGYPNSFHALIRFTNGGTGVLSADWAAGRRVQTVEMHANGISAFTNLDKSAVIYADDCEQPRVLDVKQAAGSDEFRVYYGFTQENRHFIDCVKAGTTPTTNFAEAVHTMDLAQAIERGTV